MRDKRFVFLLVFLSLVLSGCQKLTPKLPEEKEATVGQILERPQEYRGLEVKTSGILKLSKKGLVLEDRGLEMVISTESSKIKAEDFVDQNVELGGVLETKAGEEVLEIDWIGVVEEEDLKDHRIAEETKKGLASALGVEEEEIGVVSIEEIQWGDACLDIPEPGVMCAQVVTPGFKIVYRVAGKNYEVHTNLNGTLGILVEPRKRL
jgi:hypothetical protein